MSSFKAAGHLQPVVYVWLVLIGGKSPVACVSYNIASLWDLVLFTRERMSLSVQSTKVTNEVPEQVGNQTSPLN